MKSGQVPIHVMRFAPSDYANDPFVRRMYQKRDWRTAAFYPIFLFYSHIEGGDLPAKLDDLAAIVLMPERDVEAALKVCVAAGVIREEGGRLFNRRVRAELEKEYDFRRNQAESGRRGAQARINKDGPSPIQGDHEASPGQSKGGPKPVGGAGRGEALAGRDGGEAGRGGEPTKEPATSDFASARAACLRELEAASEVTRIPADQLLAKASRTPSGSVITNIAGCDRLPWLVTTTDKLRGMRLAVEADIPQPVAHESPPPLTPVHPPAQDVVDRLLAVLEGTVKSGTYSSWFRGCWVGVGLQGDTLRIRVPNEATAKMAEGMCAPHVRKACETIGRPDLKLLFEPSRGN